RRRKPGDQGRYGKVGPDSGPGAERSEVEVVAETVVAKYARTGDAPRDAGSAGDPARGGVPGLYNRDGRTYGANRAAANERNRDRQGSRRRIAWIGEEPYGGVEGPHLLPPWSLWISR